jgi:hypothetical protein
MAMGLARGREDVDLARGTPEVQDDCAGPS